MTVTITQPTLLDRILDESQKEIKDRMSRSKMVPGTAREFDLMLSDLLLYSKEMLAIAELLKDKGVTIDPESTCLISSIETLMTAYLKGRLPYGFVPDPANKRPAL